MDMDQHAVLATVTPRAALRPVAQPVTLAEAEAERRAIARDYQAGRCHPGLNPATLLPWTPAETASERSRALQGRCPDLVRDALTGDLFGAQVRARRAGRRRRRRSRGERRSQDARSTAVEAAIRDWGDVVERFRAARSGAFHAGHFGPTRVDHLAHVAPVGDVA